MSAVGSWAWAQATNGRLRRRDRAELLRQAVLARLSRVPSPLRRAMVNDGRSLILPEPPDSALAVLAEERVRKLSTPGLHAHCLRTWLFAALLGRRDDVRHDPELLYLACLLHDLGLTDAHDGQDPSAACFAVEGARAAHALLCANGESDHRARTVAEAITLHLNVTVPASLGAEASLLSRGVQLDTVGRDLRRLPASSIQKVTDRWPRDGIGDYLAATVARQARLRPDSRTAFVARLGFAGLIAANPLDRHPEPINQRRGA